MDNIEKPTLVWIPKNGRTADELAALIPNDPSRPQTADQPDAPAPLRALLALERQLDRLDYNLKLRV